MKIRFLSTPASPINVAYTIDRGGVTPVIQTTPALGGLSAIVGAPVVDTIPILGVESKPSQWGIETNRLIYPI